MANLFFLITFVGTAMCQLAFHPPTTRIYTDDICSEMVFTETYTAYHFNCLADGADSYYFEHNSTTFTERIYSGCADCLSCSAVVNYYPAVPNCSPFGSTGFFYEAPGGMSGSGASSREHSLRICTPTIAGCGDPPSTPDWCRRLQMEPDECVPNSDHGGYVTMIRDRVSDSLLYIEDSDSNCAGGSPVVRTLADGVCVVDPTWNMKVLPSLGDFVPLWYGMSPFFKVGATELECQETDVGNYFHQFPVPLDNCVPVFPGFWISRTCTGGVLTLQGYEDAACTLVDDDPLDLPLLPSLCQYYRGMWMRNTCDDPPAFTESDYVHFSVAGDSCGQEALFDVYMRNDGNCLQLPWSWFFDSDPAVVSGKAICDGTDLTFVTHLDEAACVGNRTEATVAEGECILGTANMFFRNEADGCGVSSSLGVVAVMEVGFLLLGLILVF